MPKPSTRLAVLAAAASVCACSLEPPAPMARQAPGGHRYSLAAVSTLAPGQVLADSTSTGTAAQAADGDALTAWTNGGYRNPTAWLSLGFAGTASFSSVAVKTGMMPAGTSYDVQVSADGTSWTTVLAAQTNTTWASETKALPAGVTGRYLRLCWHNSASAPQPHFSVYELAASGTMGAPTTPPPAPQPTPVPAPVPPGVYPSPAAAAAAYASHTSLLGSGLRGPNGLARAADDTLYESDWNGNTVTRVTQAGVCTTYASGFGGPAGLAFNPAGELLVAGYNSHTLEKIPVGGGSHHALVTTGLNRPVWPAVNAQGLTYLADYSNNRIAAVTSTGMVSTFKTMASVNAIDLDPQGNLWVCTWGGTIAKLTPQGTQTTIATGLPTACGIAWCPNYLAVVTYGGQNQRNGRLLLVDFAGKSYEVATGLDRASSCLFDSKGAVYTANVGDSALRKYALR